MEKRLKHHMSYLQLLSKSHAKQRKAILQSATPEQIKILSEIVLNLLEGNIPLTPKQKRVLQPHEKAFLRVSGRKSSSLQLRRIWLRIANSSLLILLQTILPYLVR